MTPGPTSSTENGLLSLAGRRALVTGAGTGLGRDIAHGLAEAGADVVLVGRTETTLVRTAGELERYGIEAVAIPTDITVEAQVRALGRRAGAVDILVNNAGVAPNQHWLTVPLDEWRHTFAVNVDAPFRLCQLFAPGMMERRWGRIINIASVYGRMGGNPGLYVGLDWDVPSYFASKHAVHGITHYLATRLAPHGVTINSLSPGGFAGSAQNEASGMDSDAMVAAFEAAVPMARRGGPADIKACAVFLASPGSGYVTGQDLVVDGGWTVW
jgi:NAD(P)-dependent dehydrogenase (short-subunit alcohol dehydrogenase family)